MFVNFANFIDGANSRRVARILAFTIYAGFVRWAFAICSTAEWCAVDARIALITGYTFTHCAMLDGLTNGIPAALFALASGHAEIIAARMRARAI